MIYSVLVAASGLVVPLLLAAVVGMIAVPVVDHLEERGVPRPIGALLLIALLLAVVVGAAVVVVRGVIEESIEIRVVLIEGVSTIDDWVADGTIIGDPEAVVAEGADQGQPLLAGLASWATTIFSSAVAFSIGVFLALFILYYLLVDWAAVRSWLARHLTVSESLGTAIFDDATEVVRRGFGALTLTSLATAGVIGLAMLLLGLPLAAAVAVVTFVASYVPYLGALISTVFAFLIALGSGGIRDALIILVVILITRNVIRTIVGNRLTSDRLSLHPLPSIISSVCGVAIAGLLGAMLSAPALALAIAVSRRIRNSRPAAGQDTGTALPPAA